MSHSIDLPADLYQQAMAIAAETASNVSEVVATLLRDGLQRQTKSAQGLTYDPVTGFPQFSFGRTITEADVRSLEDENQ